MDERIAETSDRRNRGGSTERLLGAHAVRLATFGAAVIAVGILTYTVLAVIGFAGEATRTFSPLGPGWDLRLYIADMQRFMATGTPYAPWQLSGPYDSFRGQVFLYPPVALYLMLPFLVLPAFLWWAIPVAVTVWALWRLRPTWWSWPLIALCLAWPRSIGSLVAGNTDTWVAAFVAAGCVLGWPILLVAIKPSFAPLAFIAVRRRSWWVGLVMLSLSSLPLFPLWLQWIQVVRFGNADLAYSLLNLPLALVGIVAAVPRFVRGHSLSSPRHGPDHLGNLRH